MSIDLPDDPNVEIDWRLGFTILFYMLFAFTQSVLASVEQKPGLRMAMGLGIMFCIDEVMILQDVSAFIKEGMKSDPSVQRVLSIFPQSYCTFEIVMLSRFLYFLLFNLICSVSITYVINESKERIRLGALMEKQMSRLTALTLMIYEKFESKELSLFQEIKKKEYLYERERSLQEMQIELAALQTGKTKEELLEQKQKPKA